MPLFTDAKPVAFVNVGDRDRGRHFYGETLGLALHSSDAFGDFYAFGAGLMRLTALPDYQPHPHPVLGWHVPDISAAVAALAARGVAMKMYDGMGQGPDGVWTAPDGSAKVAWFNDLDGNLLSLSQ